MADMTQTNLHPAESDAERGAEAARCIWKRGRQAEDLIDPQTPSFAHAVIDGLMAELSSSPGTVREMMENALHAAADLNVAPFQGLDCVFR